MLADLTLLPYALIFFRRLICRRYTANPLSMMFASEALAPLAMGDAFAMLLSTCCSYEQHHQELTTNYGSSFARATRHLMPAQAFTA